MIVVHQWCISVKHCLARIRSSASQYANMNLAMQRAIEIHTAHKFFASWLEGKILSVHEYDENRWPVALFTVAQVISSEAEPLSLDAVCFLPQYIFEELNVIGFLRRTGGQSSLSSFLSFFGFCFRLLILST
jgi:hypothetical protein